MVLFTLRAADEVRAVQFGSPEANLDTEMVAIAGAIIKQRTSACDPGAFLRNEPVSGACQIRTYSAANSRIVPAIGFG